MYHAAQYIIKKTEPLFDYMDEKAHAANNLHNTALFHIRQVFTGVKKADADRTQTQKEVFGNIQSCLPAMNAVRENTNRKREVKNEEIRQQNTVIAQENEVRKGNGQKPLPLIPEKEFARLFEMPTTEKSFPGYGFLEALLKASKNDCYFAPCLPRQTAQGILKEVCGDFSNWFAALRKYKKDPGQFTGRPCMPKYRKSGGLRSVVFSNQDCVIYDGMLKFPGIRTRLVLGSTVPVGARLKQVKVCPHFGAYKVCVVWDDGLQPPELSEKPVRIAAIDFGVDNFAAAANNIGQPGLLFKGGVVKSENQWFNKKKAQAVSDLTRGRKTEKYPQTHRLKKLSAHRDGVLRTQINTCARRIVDQCAEWGIDTIVLGVNKGWKQKTDMRKESNQKFVCVPHDQLRRRIRELGRTRGIRVVDQEESYTSKASFPDGDVMPIYGEEGAHEATFSGYRASKARGRYKLNGQKAWVNSDLNAAGNILRKKYPDAISPSDNRFLREIIVLNPKDSQTQKASAVLQNHNKSNPVRRSTSKG